MGRENDRKRSSGVKSSRHRPKEEDDKNRTEKERRERRRKRSASISSSSSSSSSSSLESSLRRYSSRQRQQQQQYRRQHSYSDDDDDSSVDHHRRHERRRRRRRRRQSDSSRKHKRRKRRGKEQRTSSDGRKRLEEGDDASTSDSSTSYRRRPSRRHLSHHRRHHHRRRHPRRRHRPSSHHVDPSESKDHHHHHPQVHEAAQALPKPVSDVEDSSSHFHEDLNDSSSKDIDDSYGHFEGGPGTLIYNQYTIVRDVGMGTFGRVVEATTHHHHHHHRRPQKVAIKIVRNVKRYQDSAWIEADIVQNVNSRGGRGRSLVAVLLDRFDWKGHACLVFECLGPSLYDFLKHHDYRPFPLYCVRHFATQLLNALDFIHSFGLIHTDLKPENILLTNPHEITYRHPFHKNMVQQVPASTHIKVIDFGGATYDYEKKSSVINTRQYRAPEVILGLGWSMPSDLWSAGCIIAELYMGELLFATHDNTEHLALMERAIGRFPLDILAQSRQAATHNNNNTNCFVFDSYGWHKMNAVLSPSSLSHVRKMGPLESLVTDHDKPSGLVHLLRSLLTIDPNVRSTAKEALQKSQFCSTYQHNLY